MFIVKIEEYVNSVELSAYDNDIVIYNVIMVTRKGHFDLVYVRKEKVITRRVTFKADSKLIDLVENVTSEIESITDIRNISLERHRILSEITRYNRITPETDLAFSEYTEMSLFYTVVDYLVGGTLEEFEQNNTKWRVTARTLDEAAHDKEEIEIQNQQEYDLNLLFFYEKLRVQIKEYARRQYKIENNISIITDLTYTKPIKVCTFSKTQRYITIVLMPGPQHRTITYYLVHYYIQHLRVNALELTNYVLSPNFITILKANEIDSFIIDPNIPFIVQSLAMMSAEKNDYIALMKSIGFINALKAATELMDKPTYIGTYEYNLVRENLIQFSSQIFISRGKKLADLYLIKY